MPRADSDRNGSITTTWSSGHLLLDPGQVGGGDAHVVGDRQQPLDLAPARHLEDLDVGRADTGELVGLDAPSLRDDRTMLVVGDRTPRRELVAALAPFTTALTVALSGEHVDAAARLADVSAGERDVDHRQDVVGAHRLLLGPAGVQDHAAVGRADQPGQFAHRRRRYVGRRLDVLGPPLPGGRDRVVEADGAAVDEVDVEQSLAFDLAQQAEEQRPVGAGPDGDLHVVVLHPPAESGIDRDHPGPRWRALLIVVGSITG